MTEPFVGPLGEKSQDLRVLDVFVLGPFMLWSARFLPAGVPRAAMIASGALTIWLNGRNFLAKRRGEA